MHAPWLRLIGPPAWFHPGGELPFAPERPFQLMALLAHRGDWVPRERLAALFWPGHGAEAARRNLRKVLFRLRDLAALPPPEDAAGALRWVVETDLQRLQHALAAGALQAVADAWAAQPFEGLDGDGAFAEWVAFERQALRNRWRAALLQGAAAATDPLQAAHWAACLCQHDPLDEEALRLRMQALMQAGRSADARQAYQVFEAALARDLAARPEAATQVLAAQLQLSPPAPPRPNPAAVPGLVGRKAELQALQALLDQPGLRWLTLLGPGGIGKTTLAQAVVANRFDAALVSLQDLHAADDVPARVAQVLDLGTAARHWDGLAHAFSARPVLLVLDGVEQVQGLAVAMAAVLDGCSGLRVLATSRQRLGLPGEHVFDVGGLPFPDAEDDARSDDFDAVRLFVQAAQRKHPGFDARLERDAVAALCRAVEGWPLALELCAAWTPRLRVADILHDLRQGHHDLLRRPGGAADDRHGSLQRVLDPSWQVLGAAEQQAAARLSLLDEPASTDVARAVAAAPLPRLAALADAAWVRRESGGRWGLHPLVRHHLALQRQAQPAWHDAAVDALCGHLAQRADRCPPRSQWQARDQALDLLAVDLPALKQAWRCCVAVGRADRLDLLREPLFALLVRQQAWADGVQLLSPALDRLHGQPLARLQACIAYLQVFGAQLGASIERARPAVRVLQRGADRHALLLGLLTLGQGLMRSAQGTAARHVLRRAQVVARSLGDLQTESQVLDALSGVAYAQGRHDEQIALLEQAIALATAHGLRPVMALSNLGNALRITGRLEAARDAYERGLAMAAQDPRLRRERATVLVNLGLLLGDQGPLVDHARAYDCAVQGLQAAADGVDPRIEAHLLSLIGAQLLHLGDLAAARTQLLRALVAARRLSLMHAQQCVLLDWSRWLHGAGRTDEAFRVLGCVAAQADFPIPDRTAFPGLRQEWGAATGDPDPREAEGAALSLAELVDRTIARG